MKITALRVVNYKGFFDSGFVELGAGWNVVVGQNNAGKTAFMEGFRLRNNENKVHKNISFDRDFPYPPQSRFIARMRIGREWLKNAWLKRLDHFDLPVTGGNEAGRSELDASAFWDGDDLEVEIEFRHGTNATSEWPSHRLFSAQGNEIYVQILPTADRKVGVVGARLGGRSDTLPIIVDQAFQSHIYMFDAKRFAVGECRHEDSNILRPDASNLPAVLIKLHGNPDLLREFNENVTAIFPSIRGVTATTRGSNFEIRVWSVDPSTRRDDLSVPLNESGTGVGQVLAILYVAMTNEAGVIAIDEPNSFLHPGAAKKLIQILKRYDQHQYIISTHSPEVIGTAQPARLHMVRFDGQQSRVQSFDDAEVETKRMMLEEVGASLSDIFSAEKVIWVEGPTEKECFNLIVERAHGGPIVGLSFVALRNTGDFDGRQGNARAVLDIYDSLSQGGSILPTTVAFSFDGEGKSPTQIEDLVRRCDGRARVLGRRMTENYLLDPDAIASVLTSLGESDVDAANIEGLLRQFVPARMPKGDTGEWGSIDCTKRVDAANLLKDVFHAATQGRQEYRKVRDAVDLTRALLDNNQDKISELIEYVGALIADRN